MNCLSLVVLLVASVASAARLYTDVAYVPTFDFDGNLLFSAATVKLEHYQSGVWIPVNVTVEEWIRINQSQDPSYRPSSTMDKYWDFSDEGGDYTFASQVEKAYTKQGPAFPLFRAHFAHGVPFNVLTARGHDPRNLQTGFERLIELAMTSDERINNVKNFLSWTTKFFDFPNKPGWWAEAFATAQGIFKQYIRGCTFYAVGNPWIEKRIGCVGTAACKAYMVGKIVDQALAYAGEPTRLTVISFFDDEKPNIDAVTNAMTQYLAPAHPELCFRVYDTSNATIPAKQIDISASCANIAPGVDWQSEIFLAATKGIRVNAF